jgi:CubicO group peptidase (beta-lactamase class C family)
MTHVTSAFDSFIAAAHARIDRASTGNVVFVLLANGEVVDTYSASFGKPVNADSVFQVASISKWVTAWGVLALWQSGRVDLDAPYSRYAKRWVLPPSDYDHDQVTISRLLSHSAGLIDGLGYGGFLNASDVQSLEESLKRAADGEGDAAVRVGMTPGSEFRYSGGGYTLLQLLIEDVTGQPFEDYMQDAVLRPLGMAHSTFDAGKVPAATRAESYDVDLTLAPHYRFTALAAASLYTSALDLTRFLQAHLAGGSCVLTAETLAQMAKPHFIRFIVPHWGLGPCLTILPGSAAPIIGHHGFNRPSINTAAHVHPESGHGIIILESGHPDLAAELFDGWVYYLSRLKL